MSSEKQKTKTNKNKTKNMDPKDRAVEQPSPKRVSQTDRTLQGLRSQKEVNLNVSSQKQVPYTYTPISKNRQQTCSERQGKTLQTKRLSALTDCLDENKQGHSSSSGDVLTRDSEEATAAAIAADIGPNVHLYTMEKNDLNQEISQSVIAQGIKIVAQNTLNGFGQFLQNVSQMMSFPRPSKEQQPSSSASVDKRKRTEGVEIHPCAVFR